MNKQIVCNRLEILEQNIQSVCHLKWEIRTINIKKNNLHN